MASLKRMINRLLRRHPLPKGLQASGARLSEPEQAVTLPDARR